MPVKTHPDRNRTQRSCCNQMKVLVRGKFEQFKLPMAACPLSRMDIVEMEEHPKAQMLMIEERTKL